MNKWLVVLLLGLSVAWVRGQSSLDQFNQEVRYYEGLAVKLYPDSAVHDSALVKMIYKMDSVLAANHSRLSNLSSKPLVLSVEAASILKIQPRWDALTEGERNTVFDAIAIGLVDTHDLSPSDAGLTSTPAAQPSTTGPGQEASSAGQTVAAPNPQASTLAPSRSGFLWFYNDLVNRSEGLKGQKGGPAIYRSGPLQGKTEGEGKIYAQEQWAQMSQDQKIACEQNAGTYGTGPDPDVPQTSGGSAPEPPTHQYTVTPTGNGGSTVTGY